MEKLTNQLKTLCGDGEKGEAKKKEAKPKAKVRLWANIDTLVLTEAEDKEYLMSLIGNKELKLIWRASRDGPNIKNFHKLCDDKGPTLTLFR